MSANNVRNEADPSWKVLWNTVNRETLWNVIRNRRSAARASYEPEETGFRQKDSDSEFFHASDEPEQSPHNDDNNADSGGQDMLGDWGSEDDRPETDLYKDDKNTCRMRFKYDLTSSDQEDTTNYETISDCSEDEQNFDDYCKAVKESQENGAQKETMDEFGTMPYSSLTDALLRDYCPPKRKPKKATQGHAGIRKRGKNEHYTKENIKEDKMSLEDRLPMMQVIDALDDINQVLKVGKLTPRMERIMEYKLNYPFEEGYHEDILGWCPYLVYKIERFFKKFYAKQWPFLSFSSAPDS